MQKFAGESRHAAWQAHRVHRPDIEGLRAISILAVALYHAQVGGFAGGFVGVDIFFVISGFLITGLLLEEATATGRIDLLRFWARRARRLLPNALLVVLAVLAIGAAIVPRYLHKMLIDDIGAAVIYVANFRFAAQAVEYFRPAGAGPSLVLHFWSLNIEEQFYFAWPLLLLGAALAFPRRIVSGAVLVLALVWVASLATALIMVRYNQPLAFFHTGARCWQLATGGLLAAAWPLVAALPQRLRSMATWAGLAGIAASIGVLNDEMVYPGAWALLPTLSTAAVIAGGQADKVLGLTALQWLGARSYSWYLWHWPVLLLAKAMFPAHALTAAVLSLPVSLAIAAAVYKFLEDPIRRGQRLIARPVTFIGLSAGGAAAVLLTGWLFGFVSRHVLPPPTDLASRLAAAAQDAGRNYQDKCSLGFSGVKQPECAYGAAHAKHRAVLFGDSHAAQWFEPLVLAANASRWRLHTWTKSACPAAEVSAWNSQRNAPYPECDQWREGIMRVLTGPMRPDLVFISSNTRIAKAVDRGTGHVLYQPEAEKVWRRGFRATLQRLIDAGIEVVVIRDTPRTRKDFAGCLILGGGAECDASRDKALRSDPPDVAVATELGVRVLDLADRICDSAVCPLVKDGIFVYRDDNHITATFARTLADDFRRELDRRVALQD